MNTLAFKYRFRHDEDVVEFTYSQPYTYSDLREDLGRLKSHSPYIEKSISPVRWIRRGLLCNSPGNVPCEYLIISSPQSGKNERKKLGAILTARVHPGETVGSLVMKGAIDFLTSREPEAARLREDFLFLVVPMLNPDGVIVGNNRYGLDGSDFNRKFTAPSKASVALRSW